MAKRINKIVFDTNILISAFVYPSGAIREIVDYALSRRIKVFTSAAILNEYSRVLELKFKWKKDDIMENIRLVADIFIMVEPSETVSLVKKDPDDDRILECALASKADIIISGDKHLLNLKTFRGIKILKPSDFIKTIKF